MEVDEGADYGGEYDYGEEEETKEVKGDLPKAQDAR